MSDSTQHSKKLRVAATLHDESGQSPFWATVVLYEDLRAAAVCRGATSRESEELARHLVAAWNACTGVSTQTLEEADGTELKLLLAYDALKAQRKDLLTSFEALVDRLKDSHSMWPEWQAAYTAIARATGAPTPGNGGAQ